MEEYMVPNNERPDREQQEFIVRVINDLGYEPFDKPIHLYSLDEVEEIGEMYREVAGEPMANLRTTQTGIEAQRINSERI